MKNAFNGFKQKVDKQKLIKDLKYTIEKNQNALDCFVNELNRAKDRYAYTENEQDKELVENLEYVVCTLSFLDDSYRTALRRC